MKGQALRNGFKLLFLLILIALPFRLEALIKFNKLWTGFNIQKALDKEKKWMVALTSQLRFTNQHHHLRLFFIEPAIGYQYTNNSVWMGYRWGQHIPRRTFQHHRLFQQIIYKPEKTSDCYSCLFRTRLEEFNNSNRKQVAIRLRQRNNIELLNMFKDRAYFFDKINPLIYDEFFIMLNKTNYTSHNLIAENRLFLGFNFYVDKEAWWEVGYLLQFRSKLPFNRQNQLNNVLSINYFYK